MNRRQKSTEISSLVTAFEKSTGAFIVDIQGLTVGQILTLRKELRTHGATMRVSKNTLVRRATADMKGAQDLEPYFKNQVALVFASGETPAVAKVLCSKSETIKKLAVRAGLFEGSVIDAKRVNFIASLPSREVLIAQLCGLLLSPVAQLASVLSQVAEKATIAPSQETQEI